ncbi:LTA synthase family protein [uncultured Castellaniella sp.]|uniref:LTA synthase family protein n=1 Tax=uncultured Castellaniella sp. TaxID=647907 RepID=UPI002617E6F6|nr:LTA synthase family protein [uncultured Castellaniella sp.]
MLAAASLGAALSVAIERLMAPRPPLRRPAAAWAVHAGLWCLAHAALTLALGRPWFAAAVVCAFWLVLVLVNNAKYKSLREPFVFHDYEYFTDAIRHPRLYIPFLGWAKFSGATVGVLLAVAVGLWAEEALEDRWNWSGHLGGLCAVALSGGLLLWGGASRLPAATFRPAQDLAALGFLACLWRYARAAGQRPCLASPFDFAAQGRPVAASAHAAVSHTGTLGADLPHLVAIQSESFFDPRVLYAGIRRDVLAQFDRLRGDAALCGDLTVPAWGANTIRTEFAFLSGIAAERLGVHRFNPYRALAAEWRLASLASWLKALGYRTVCVHPYPAAFYQRDRVYPQLGFDAFFDIHAFAGRRPEGPYVGDGAVADKVSGLLSQSGRPLFVMAITMENHGPLHLETVRPDELDALYTQPPPPDCKDLTVYLRHLRHADQMAASLRDTLESLDRPASLCWYGDHVPIMPEVYRRYGLPSGRVPYVCWNNWASAPGRSVDLAAEDLSRHWLQRIGLMQ